MVMGKPFTDFILEHHPQTSRRITINEALGILQAEHERGHVHSAWFKDAMVDRFYGICNCCKCCCGGIKGMTQFDIPMVASSGYVAQHDESLCDSCEDCQDSCPFNAIQVNGKAVVNWDKCMGCGVCIDQCPQGALTLVRDELKGVPLDVRLLQDESVAA